jgi:crotonobetainyl-CoA:carnitine CoA-transferase CaiB-like acyl-CoA transferase
MAASGAAPSDPINPRSQEVQHCTGLLGAFGLGLGLLHRLRTGEGAHVETSLGHAATYLQLPYMQTYEGKTWDEPSGPQAHGWGALQRLYRAADAWFFLGAKETQIERLAAGGDAEEVLAMISMADKLNELAEKRVIALD